MSDSEFESESSSSIEFSDVEESSSSSSNSSDGSSSSSDELEFADSEEEEMEPEVVNITGINITIPSITPITQIVSSDRPIVPGLTVPPQISVSLPSPAPSSIMTPISVNLPGNINLGGLSVGASSVSPVIQPTISPKLPPGLFGPSSVTVSPTVVSPVTSLVSPKLPPGLFGPPSVTVVTPTVVPSVTVPSVTVPSVTVPSVTVSPMASPKLPPGLFGTPSTVVSSTVTPTVVPSVTVSPMASPKLPPGLSSVIPVISSVVTTVPPISTEIMNVAPPVQPVPTKSLLPTDFPVIGVDLQVVRMKVLLILPPGVWDEYKEYFEIRKGKYQSDLGRYGKIFEGKSGWVFARGLLEKIQELVIAIGTGRMPPPGQHVIPKLDDVVTQQLQNISKSSPGNVDIQTRIVPGAETFGQNIAPQSLIPKDLPSSKIGKAPESTPLPSTIISAIAATPNLSGIPGVNTGIIQEANRQFLEDPDQKLAKLYLEKGGSVNMKYSVNDILNMSPEHLAVFVQLFGLPSIDSLAIRQRLVRILQFLGAIPSDTPNPIAGLISSEVPVQAISVNQPAPTQLTQPIQVFLPTYTPGNREAGESDARYRRRVQIYQYLLSRGANASQADTLSRMRMNVDFDGVQYNPNIMEYLQKNIPSI